MFYEYQCKKSTLSFIADALQLACVATISFIRLSQENYVLSTFIHGTACVLALRSRTSCNDNAVPIGCIEVITSNQGNSTRQQVHVSTLKLSVPAISDHQRRDAVCFLRREYHTNETDKYNKAQYNMSTQIHTETIR